MRYALVAAASIAAALLGWRSSQTLKKRALFLAALVQTLRRLAVLLNYSSSRLSTLARNVADARTTAFWNAFADALDGGQAPEGAFTSAASHIPALDTQTLEILGTFYSQLGKSERASQIKLIEQTATLLANEAAEARQDAAKRGKIRQMLGVLSGIAIVIVFV